MVTGSPCHFAKFYFEVEICTMKVKYSVISGIKSTGTCDFDLQKKIIKKEEENR